MKAIIQNEYGNPTVLKLVEIEKPVYNADQVLIEIKASGINLIDAKMRAGDVAEMMPKTFPIILGWKASGTLAAIGSNVKNFQIGDEVYTHVNMMQAGTYAGYVAEKEVVLKPTNGSSMYLIYTLTGFEQAIMGIAAAAESFDKQTPAQTVQFLNN